jgi:hypothetical protein
MTDNKRAQVWVVVAFLVLVCVSVLVTSLTVINMRKSEGQGSSRQVTMTDAYMKCVDKTKKEFGSRLAGNG